MLKWDYGAWWVCGVARVCGWCWVADLGYSWLGWCCSEVDGEALSERGWGKEWKVEHVILHGWPNTYVFTKAMGEILLMKMKDTLPLFVIRPTTVVSTHSEPFPGWIEGVRCIIYHILYIYIYIINKRIIWVSWKI